MYIETLVASLAEWLGARFTNTMVPGSVPAVGFFLVHTRKIKASGSTQPLKMGTREIWEGKCIQA